MAFGTQSLLRRYTNHISCCKYPGGLLYILEVFFVSFAEALATMAVVVVVVMLV